MVVSVFEALDLHVAPGAFVAFLGPSGCGKTTLLRLIAGLDSPSKGEVLRDGQPVRGPQDSVGIVFQQYASYPWLTVYQNVEFGLKLHPNVWPARKRDDQVKKMLQLVGLEVVARAYPDSLSGGMRQRVALARSIAVGPEILLLDEPFGALDAQSRMILQDELARICEKLKSTACLVTHDIDEALLLAERIFVLSAKPARITATIDTTFASARDNRVRFSEDFNRQRAEIFELIRDDAWSALSSARRPGESSKTRRGLSGR
jgi:NitT/TauT family transport system ATP-binding protein